MSTLQQSVIAQWNRAITKNIVGFGIMSRRLIVAYHVRQFATTFGEENSHYSVSKKDLRYCVDVVQNRDRESYLCGLLMPSDSRKAFFAVRAWNVELASINDGTTKRKQVNEGDDGVPNLAIQVRMQWWRDALDRIYGWSDHQGQEKGIDEENSGPFAVSRTLAASYFKNPIVRVMKYAVHEKKLTKRFLERLSEARQEDSKIKQPRTLDDLVFYSDNIYSSLLYLSLETVNVRDESVDVVAQHAGIGIGLMMAIRGIRFRLIREECPIPKELLPVDFPYDKLFYTNHCDLSESTEDGAKYMLSGEEQQILKNAIQEICNLASSHLSEAQKLQRNVPIHARSCFLPVIPALHILSKLEEARYNIFDRNFMEHDNITILALLGKTWLTGTF